MKQKATGTQLKTFTRVLVWVGLFILTAFFYSCIAPSGEMPNKTREYLKAGPYDVDYREIMVIDDSYANGENTDETLLPFSVWYPKIPERKEANFDVAAFPIILMCPGFNAGHESYATVLAYLAGHGYIIGSFPSRGSEFTGGERSRSSLLHDVHLRHLGLALEKTMNIRHADGENIGVMGHSFGGPSALVYALRHNNVRAVVSLDGSEVCRNATAATAADFPEFSANNLAVPFMLLLADRNYCTGPNRSLDFYNGLENAPAFVLNFPELSHDDFAFDAVRPTEQASRRSCEIAGRYVLDFFNAFLKNDRQSLMQLEKAADKSGYPAELFGISMKNIKDE